MPSHLRRLELSSTTTVRPPARALVVCDVRLYLDLLSEQLRATTGVVVVGSAENASQALKLAYTAHPDVAILDSGMRGGLELIRNLSSGALRLRVIVVGIEESEQDIVACAAA